MFFSAFVLTERTLQQPSLHSVFATFGGMHSLQQSGAEPVRIHSGHGLGTGMPLLVFSQHGEPAGSGRSQQHFGRAAGLVWAWAACRPKPTMPRERALVQRARNMGLAALFP